ncbi:surface-adhesin E family protein [Crenobacter cavernae]|uniref:Surface-adhesin protein E-like domain-containing protein n=1 Tax=Crenobacter cavernae TaxID=2290923 RepID=A0A345Y5J2_9NEIS|nr:surface-adhesin E family protein [Crenobacter cavernae]AXK39194.1 hypothetical protein DWG20_06970 [Crenobacter cavernae]
MLYRVLLLSALTAALAGCATGPSSMTGGRPTVKPEANANWHNLGVSPNGNILNELDERSIRRQGSLVTFRDRKTIFNPKKENFLSTPPHKYSINSWQIDCSARTFRLMAVALFDENGRQTASYTYNDAQIKPMPVVQNSASFQQMQFVCGHSAV